jgi:hypothetical protein
MNKKSLAYTTLLILWLTSFLTWNARGDTDGWEVVAPGVEYQQFKAAGPNDVFVARMDRSNPHVTIETSIAQGRLSKGRETVKGMYHRSNGTLTYWGEQWGGWNRVAVAINGYYFDPETGVPWRGQVQSGWYARRFDDNHNGSGFVWSLDGTAFIGGCVKHPSAAQLIYHPASDREQKFQGINIARGEDELILYTPQYDSSTGTDGGGLEIRVELTRPMLIVPGPAKVTGTVREVRDRKGDTPLRYDEVVLSASGFLAQKLRDFNILEGDEIWISQEVAHYEPDCKTRSSDSWTKAYASMGGDFHFLRSGDIDPYPDYPQATGRLPRTAVAYSDAYVFFIVVDGRNPGVSVGMSIEELARFARDTLGATDGIAQDSGGSSTMVINGQVVNNTTCNFADCTDDPPGERLEALVANSYMMVVAEPFQRSPTAFPLGSEVIARQNARIRLGPGRNYPSIGTATPGAGGIILEDANHLEGVLETSAYWWKVRIGELEGWVEEGQFSGGIFHYLPFMFKTMY